MKSDINETLLQYLNSGAGIGYAPADCNKRLKQKYQSEYESKLKSIEPYLDFDLPQSQWPDNNLSNIAKEYIQKAKSKFPELNEQSLNSLASYFTYQWR